MQFENDALGSDVNFKRLYGQNNHLTIWGNNWQINDENKIISRSPCCYAETAISIWLGKLMIHKLIAFKILLDYKCINRQSEMGTNVSEFTITDYWYLLFKYIE